VSLGNTGELHDKSTLLIVKMILEKCPDTRHTVAMILGGGRFLSARYPMY